MGRKTKRSSGHRLELIEDIHIARKRENRARSLSKAMSEYLISAQQRQMDNLKRKSVKLSFDTYQEMSTYFNLLMEEDYE